MIHNRTILNGKYKMDVEVHAKSKMVIITGRAKIFEIREVLVAIAEEIEMAAMKRRQKKTAAVNQFGLSGGPGTGQTPPEEKSFAAIFSPTQEQQPLFPEQGIMTVETAKAE